MKRAFLLLMALLSLLPFASAEEESFWLESERELSLENVRAAAQPLINRGARVAVFWVNSGSAEDFTARLQAENLMQGELIADDVIALYVSMDPRYSEILWGDNWKLGAQAENIRLNILNVNLRERQYERAFTETLRVLEDVQAGNIVSVPVNLSSPEHSYKTEEGLSGWVTSFIFCFIFPIILIFHTLGINNGEGNGSGGSTSSKPLYKSSWSSTSKSASRSSGSFGRGGRSGGGW